MEPKYKWGRNHLRVFCLYLHTHIYSVAVQANNAKEKKKGEEEIKKSQMFLEDTKYTWKNIPELLHSEIPQ